jgi:3-hydroxyisobutyrate dehydrogenase
MRTPASRRNESQAVNIGYIGLGALGSELAKCFVNSHTLHVWDRDPAACQRLASVGARVASTAADVGRSCDVVFLCLPRSSDVRELLFAPAGLSEGLSGGKVVVDQTSGVPHETGETALRLRERGVSMMDAAVSASPQVVASGGATLMASGADDVVDRVRPLLQVITRNIFRCGERVGDGQAMKMVNNAMNAGCRLATLELVALGRKAGLSLAAMTEVLDRGMARNQTTEKMLPAIARGMPSTNFALSLMLKDVNQAVELGSSVGSTMPLTRVVRSLLQVGLNTRGPAARLEDMIGVVEGMAGTHFASQEQPAHSAPEGLLHVIEQSVWALCRINACECLAAGSAYGLSVHSMAEVLNRSSGWSAALQEISTATAERVPLSRATLGSMAAILQHLGIRFGAPVFIANAAATVVDHAVRESGAEGSVDLMVRSAGLLPAAAA